MPRYINNGTTQVNFGSYTLEPGQFVDTIEYVPTLPTGVSQTTDVPYKNPIVYSAVVTSTGSYAIPSTLTGNYKITFFCSAGSVSIKLNSSNGTAKFVVAGESWTVTCLSRTVDSIIWTISSGTISVTVEQI